MFAIHCEKAGPWKMLRYVTMLVGNLDKPSWSTRWDFLRNEHSKNWAISTFKMATFSLIVTNWHPSLEPKQDYPQGSAEDRSIPKDVEVCSCWMYIWDHLSTYSKCFFLNPPCSGPAWCWCDRGHIRWDPVRARQTPRLRRLSERIQSRLASQMIEVSLQLGACTMGVLNNNSGDISQQ